jgi:hypothetical protein
METILFGDIFCLVKEYLIPIDLFHLVNTCKKYRKIITLEDIKRNTINEMYKRLRDIFRNDYEDFMYVLRKNNAVISGSFIIQCMLGEYWQDSYIDIFVHKKYNMSDDYRINIHDENEYDMDSCSDECFYSDFDSIDEDNININIVNRGIVNYLYHQNYKFLEAYYYDEENELDDIYFIVNSTRINVSIYKNNNIKKCINDNYDFDICKNICYFYDEVDHNDITISKINDIFYKRIFFSKECDSIKSFRKSYIKYFKRGFYLYTNENKDIINNNTDILNLIGIHILNCIPIKKNNFVEMINKKNKFYVEDNIIYRCLHRRNPKKIYVRIYKIENNITKYCGRIHPYCIEDDNFCIFGMMYPGINHFCDDDKIYIFSDIVSGEI